MSKVGSDKNIGKFDCSWLIIPFSEGATPAEKPEETLAKAQRSEDEMLKPYNITPAPDYKQNAGYENAYKSKCVDTHGIDFAAEKAQSYWYHSDHLGSASYITGADGKVCSNINYFPTGEVFVEQNRQIFNLPYKFNGKELDAETGYYYYGARYYNPKVSLWLNVDPLADYNPHMNDEHYKDGEHNGGVFNQMNNNPYIYCYQSPVKYVDPNGKQTLVVGVELPSFKTIENNGQTQNLNTNAGYGHVFFYLTNAKNYITHSFSFGPKNNMTLKGNVKGVDGMTNYSVPEKSRLYPIPLSEKQYKDIQSTLKNYNKNIPKYIPIDNITCANEAVGVIKKSKINIPNCYGSVKKTLLGMDFMFGNIVTPLGVRNSFESRLMESRTLDPKSSGLVDERNKIRIGIKDPYMKGELNKRP
jgi:RHS repeat-associated protein